MKNKRVIKPNNFVFLKITHTEQDEAKENNNMRVGNDSLARKMRIYC